MPVHQLGLKHHLLFIYPVSHRSSLLIFLGHDKFIFPGIELIEFFFQHVNILRPVKIIKTGHCPCFVNKVNCLVRQIAVCYVAVSEHGCLHQ